MTDRDRNRTAFAEFAAKLAAELGMTVQLREPGWGAQLGGIDGEPGYWVNEPWNAAGRVEITGIYPKTEHWFREGRPKIGCAMSRGPQTVAREIRRRLEPDYLERLAEVTASNERQARNDWAREQVALRVEELFPAGDTHRISHRQGQQRTSVSVGRYTSGGEVLVMSDGTSVSLEDFRAPAPAVLAMLEAFAAWRADNPEEEGA